MERNYLGIDIGGSGIRAAIFDQNCKLGLTYTGTVFSESPESAELFSHISLILKNTLLSCSNNLSGFGIASPGPLDPNMGIIISPPNLSKIKNFRVIECLSYLYSNLVGFLINDADAAMLGEAADGVAKEYKNVVMLTLGTGIGSGILINGRIQTGRGMGGEWGHTTIYPGGDQRECLCKRMNCLEAYCGTFGLAHTYANYFGVKFKDMTREEIFDVSKKMMANKGNDQKWNTVFMAYCRNLTESIVNICNVHHPDLVVLGGGMANQEIIDTVKEYLKNPTFASASADYKMKHLLDGMEIKLATNPNPGVIGAAKHAINQHQRIINQHMADHGIVS